jgi:hypothetical protein
MAWTSVEEKLPPYGVSVVLWDGGLTQLGYRKCTDQRGEHFHGVWNPHTDSTEIQGVTHWFEIPSPPTSTGEPA